MPRQVEAHHHFHPILLPTGSSQLPEGAHAKARTFRHICVSFYGLDLGGRDIGQATSRQPIQRESHDYNCLIFIWIHQNNESHGIEAHNIKYRHIISIGVNYFIKLFKWGARWQSKEWQLQ
ncbi:hypothetical protein NRY95_16020 [Xanthomonas campestris pv. phormiicola]|nr:hypothetical protein [Xanthomonas campestris pv. phormiicola]UYC15223.1 hypothetical protein NRY95_16020 [Xanthomonas campestris pv. phormiicola]